MTASTDARVTYPLMIKPSDHLYSGYIHLTLGNITEWVFMSAYHPLNGGANTAGDVEKHFHAPEVQSVFARLAVTFNEFFHMTAAEWEADLSQADHPVTVLQLWQTTANVFDYYTRDKKLPRGARADYFWLILRFFNNPGTSVDGVVFNTLTPARANRVLAEIVRFFQRHPAGTDAGRRMLTSL